MARTTLYIGIAVVVIVAAAGVYWYMSMQSQTQTPPPAAQKITIVAKDIKFNVTNPTITVTVGTVQITVINSDTVPHNFIIQEISSAQTSLLSPGQSQTITVNFASTGDYHYYCSVHPGQMDGIIRVMGKA